MKKTTSLFLSISLLLIIYSFPLISQCSEYGETTVDMTSNHADDFLLGQMISVTSPGILTDIGINSNTNTNDIIIGIYDDNAGQPNNLITESFINDLEIGDNIIDVNDVGIPAGDYWLMKVLDGDSNIGEKTGSVTTRYVSHTFSSPLPDPIGSTTSYTDDVFTARLIVCIEDCLSSGQMEAESNEPHSEDFLMGQKYTLLEGEYVTAVGMNVASNANKVIAAIYTDASNTPDDIVVQSGEFDLQVGDNIVDVPDVFLPAGDYWIMKVLEGTTNIGEISGYYDTRYVSLPYGNTLPDPIGTTSVFGSEKFTTWMVMCNDLDNDGVKNSIDNCVMDHNPAQGDIDNDGIGNICDNSIAVSDIANVEGLLFLEDLPSGVITKSPNGKCWMMTVTDDGTMEVFEVICP